MKIQFQLPLSRDSHSLCSELPQTCLDKSSLGFGVSCDGKLLEERSHDSSFFHPSLFLSTHTWQSQAQSWTLGGTLESLASDRHWELLGQHSFPLSEDVPALLICCGLVYALGITITVHTVPFQSLGWVACVPFLDFSMPWYHCCQGCMTASSEAPGPSLSSGRLAGDRGRASYPIHPHSFPSLSLPRPRRGAGHSDPQAT